MPRVLCVSHLLPEAVSLRLGGLRSLPLLANFKLSVRRRLPRTLEKRRLRESKGSQTEKMHVRVRPSCVSVQLLWACTVGDTRGGRAARSRESLARTVSSSRWTGAAGAGAAAGAPRCAAAEAASFACAFASAASLAAAAAASFAFAAAALASPRSLRAASRAASAAAT